MTPIRQNYLKIGYCTAIVLSLVLLFLGHLFVYNNTACKLKGMIDARDCTIDSILNLVPDSSVQIKNLTNEFKIIQETKGPYFFMARSATTMWYALTAMFTLTSVITAILAFIIAKKGWDHIENFYLKATFIIFLFASTYFGVAPLVFNNKETGRFNMQKFCFFNQQQLLIYDIIKTKQKTKHNSASKALDSLISKIDSNIRTNQEFYFDLNQDKAETDKLLKGFKN